MKRLATPRAKAEQRIRCRIRWRVPYLNGIEKLHYFYCSRVNGLCAYATEIVQRTEQHWCPVQHDLPIRAPHSPYGKFFAYGDATD